MNHFSKKINNSVIYKEAQQIYKNQQIVECELEKFENEYGEVYYKMEGIALTNRKAYNPVIVFDENEIVDQSCTCGKGLCPHIAALYFEADEFLKEKQYEVFEIYKEEKDASSLFLELFPEKDKIYNILSLDIEIKVSNNGYYRELKFDISLVNRGKKYKLNTKLGTFLMNYRESPMDFGKYYTYNPEVDVFEGWDKEFLETLKGYYSVTGYGSFTLESLLGEESIGERIMQLLEDSPYIYIEEISLKKLLDINVSSEKNDSVVMTSKNIFDINFIGKNYVYVAEITELDIYRLIPQEAENLKKLQFLFSTRENNVKIPEELFQKKAHLFNRISTLTLKGELKKKAYIPEKIEGAVYLDEDIGSNIAVQFKKSYDGIPEDEIKQFIISDEVDIDREFLKEIAEFNYYKTGNSYILFDRDEVFKFVKETVPQLQKSYDVFYSEKLKKRKYKTLSYNVSARITDLLEIDFSIEDIAPDEINELFDSIKNKKKYFILKDGGILDIEHGEELEKVKGMLDLCQATPDEISSGTIRRDKNYGYFIANVINKIENISFDEKIIEMQKDLQGLKDKIGDATLFKNFPMLRDYQQKGVQWLLLLKQMGLGGILADDMGLGKTLQVIAYLSLIEKRDKLNLVIVPKTLLYNWQSEFKKFAPHMPVKLVIGNPNIRKYIVEDAEAGDTLITTYGLISRDIELYEKKEIDVIVIDEAQNIKNFMAKTTTLVKKLKSDTRIALTGTPIENNTMELWSIFDFIFPGYLGKHSVFKNKYMENLEELREMASPFILRRTKKMVLKELPEKIENTIEVELEGTQKKLYQTYLDKYKQQFVTEEENSIELLACIMRLRQICNHPKLFIEDYRGGSSKLEALLELLEDCRSGGHRVLLFSQFTEMLKLIEKALPEGIKYLYLDGSVKTEKRMELVDKFNNGTGDLFLISLKAGGSGLNLTGADTVIHFDPWWNPSIEEQASDRAHRIGQKKMVNVYRLIARGTIEEKIEAIKQDKRELIKEVIEGERRDLLSMTKQDIIDLLMKK